MRGISRDRLGQKIREQYPRLKQYHGIQKTGCIILAKPFSFHSFSAARFLIRQYERYGDLRLMKCDPPLQCPLLIDPRRSGFPHLDRPKQKSKKQWCSHPQPTPKMWASRGAGRDSSSQPFHERAKLSAGRMYHAVPRSEFPALEAVEFQQMATAGLDQFVPSHKRWAIWQPPLCKTPLKCKHLGGLDYLRLLGCWL